MRIGILFNFLNWFGGINYLHNLIFALNSLKNKDVKVVLIVGVNTPSNIIDRFKDICEVKKDSMLDKGSLKWFISKAERKLFNTDYLKSIYLKKYTLDILSHSDFVGSNKKFKIINWIPDFQHLHLSHLFSPKDIEYREKLYRKYINCSDVVLLSSKDSYNDYKTFIKNNSKDIKKAQVLQFVTQVDINNSHYSENSISAIRDMYGLKDKFFYVPNQFWDHKNHLIVLKALKIVNKKYPDIQIVFTGSNDNKIYFEQLLKYIDYYNLNNNVKILNIIPYSHVLILFQICVAVVNPSKFEGWSTTVEECKSFSKTIVLSNIPVHKEQNPEKSYFFNLNDEYKLAKILSQLYQKKFTFENDDLLIEELKIRTREFALTYLKILINVMESDNDK